MKLTASNIVSAINRLPRNRAYDYVHPPTKTKVMVDSVELPEGPIFIKRFDPSKGESPSSQEPEPISAQMLWRIANSFSPNFPINFDRVLGGSYNTRSALEALMAHTPEFYFCYPGRIEVINESSTIQGGHKHLLWNPNNPHEQGVKIEIDTNITISEGLNNEVAYEGLNIPDSLIDSELGIDVARRHAEIQIALMEIGAHLGFKNWIARNDQSIVYKEKTLSEYESVIPDLRDDNLISSFSEAINAALYIDCIWFKNHKFLPAVLEIEHSTGITSGLTRMKGLRDQIPSIHTRYVVVASDTEREKLKREANKPQFVDLDVRFFPYSAVEELYYLCTKRNIRGIDQNFIDSFMEKMVDSELNNYRLN